MMIILKTNKLLFIEMKLPWRILKNWKRWVSPSRISEDQKEWIKKLNEINNIQAEICYWSEEAINLIKRLENIVDYLQKNK
jgi:hypothetical protein